MPALSLAKPKIPGKSRAALRHAGRRNIPQLPAAIPAVPAGAMLQDALFVLR